MPRLAGKLVGQVRLEMQKRGFTLVNTPGFFDDDLPVRLGSGRTMLPRDCERWEKLPQLARYASWLEDLLERALPEETVRLAALEFRCEAAGSVDKQVDWLHADGSYIRAVYTLYGSTTIYREAGEERPVPRGQTLVMTAQDRAREIGIPCTLHRRPGAGAKRAVIVCSLEPCDEPVRQAEVYRRVAQENRR
jgi:hypothetical protein